MTLTVRVDYKVSEALAEYCARTDQTKSDVVKLCLAEFLARQAQPTPSAYELGVDLFPTSASADAPTELSSNRKTLLKERLHAKHLNRRRPADRGV